MAADALRKTSETLLAKPRSGVPWLSAGQAAEALGKTRQAVWRMCRSGELVARQVSTGGGRSTWQIDARCRPALAIAAGLAPIVGAAEDPLAGVSAAKRAGICRRLTIVQAYEAARRRKPAGTPIIEWERYWIAGWNAQYAPGQAVSRRSVHRWASALRRSGLGGLLDRRHHAGPSACSTEAWEFFAGLYLSENRPAMPVLYEIVAAHAAAEAWAWPSLRTVRRWTAERLDPKLKALGRDPKRFRDRCLPHVERDWTQVPANHLWVADHRQFDVLLPRESPSRNGKPGKWSWYRPWLTAFLDTRTWMPVAWTIQFDAPTGNRVMETFVQGVEEHGQPAALYLDNGKDFRMYRFAGGRKRPARKGDKIVCQKHVQPLLDLLGIESHWAIPYHPESKPIESWFSIVAQRFDKTWPTYVGSRTERRPEGIKKLRGMAEEWHEKVYTIEHFRQAFEAWIKTDYALRESPSTACNGLSAARAFIELRDPDRPPQRPAATSLALLLMPSVPVRVEANGVWVKAFGRHYWSDALEDRRCGSGRDLKRKVTYRYREDDPSSIYVFDAQSDKFLCVATPYIGSGVHPLAEAGSADAKRLAEAMALQRRRAKSAKAEVARLRKVAGNHLLAAARRAGETLGLHDDPATIPAPPAPILKLTEPAIDQAGLAAQKQRPPRAAEVQTQARLNDLLATGTDDDTPPVAQGAPRQALDLLIDKESNDEALPTPKNPTPHTA